MLSIPRAPPTLSYCIKESELRPATYDIDGIEKKHHAKSGGYDVRTNEIRLYVYNEITEIGLIRKYKLISDSEQDLLAGTVDRLGEATVHELIHWGAEVFHDKFSSADFSAATSACGFYLEQLAYDFHKEKPNLKPLVIFEH